MVQQTNVKPPEYYEKNKFFRTIWDTLAPIKTNECYELSQTYYGIYFINPTNEEEKGKGIGPILFNLSNTSFRIIDIQNGAGILTYNQGRPSHHSIKSGIGHEINFVCNSIFHSSVNHKTNKVREYLRPCTFYHQNSSKSFEIILDNSTLCFERTKRHDYHIMFASGDMYSRICPSIQDGSTGYFQWEKA